MKKLLIFIVIIIFSEISFRGTTQNTFNKGVNITGWFSGGSARSIPFYKFTKKDIENHYYPTNQKIGKL